MKAIQQVFPTHIQNKLTVLKQYVLLDAPIQLKEFAKTCNISFTSVMNAINEINSLTDQMIIFKSSGYILPNYRYVNQTIFTNDSSLHQVYTHVLNTSLELNLLETLLFQPNTRQKQLAQKYSVDESTISKHLKKVRQLLALYNIDLKNTFPDNEMTKELLRFHLTAEKMIRVLGATNQTTFHMNSFPSDFDQVIQMTWSTLHYPIRPSRKTKEPLAFTKSQLFVNQVVKLFSNRSLDITNHRVTFQTLLHEQTFSCPYDKKMTFWYSYLLILWYHDFPPFQTFPIMPFLPKEAIRRDYAAYIRSMKSELQLPDNQGYEQLFLYFMYLNQRDQEVQKLFTRVHQ